MGAKTFSVLVSCFCLLGAGPATRPVHSTTEVEVIYNDQVSAAKRLYDEEVKKAGEERLAELQLLLSRAMKSEDLDQAVAIKNEIDSLKSDSIEEASPNTICV